MTITEAAAALSVKYMADRAVRDHIQKVAVGCVTTAIDVIEIKEKALSPVEPEALAEVQPGVGWHGYRCALYHMTTKMADSGPIG